MKGNGNIRFVLVVAAVVASAWWVRDGVIAHIDTAQAQAQEDPVRAWTMQKIREEGVKKCKTF